MKKILIILLIFISKADAQEEPQVALELQTWTINYEDNIIITYTMESVGKVWCKAFEDPVGYLTDDYQFASLSLTGNFTGGNGFNQCWQRQGWGIENGWFGFGVYKITISENSELRTFFYLDYRSKCDVDCTVMFDHTLGLAKIRTGIGQILTGFQDITTGSRLNIWEIWGQAPVTSYFENFWENCLISVESLNDHPKLIWGKHPNFNLTNYKIYRAISNTPANPINLTFSLIHTVNSLTYDFVDSDIFLSQSPIKHIYYYVKAYNSVSTTYSDPTNIVHTSGAVYPSKKGSTKKLEEIFSYNLEDNYPNPFNPLTRIEYSIPSDEFVTLKIYNTLGVEVATLVNQKLSKGKYSVDFDCSKLSSGVYIYQLKVNDFISSKKMVLIR